MRIYVYWTTKTMTRFSGVIYMKYIFGADTGSVYDSDSMDVNT